MNKNDSIVESAPVPVDKNDFICQSVALVIKKSYSWMAWPHEQISGYTVTAMLTMSLYVLVIKTV